MVSFLVILLCNLVWVVYSLTEGVRCGLFDHLRDSWRNKVDYNFSKMLWFQRSLVLVSISLVMFWHIGLLSLAFICGQVLMFHFLHKAAYRCTKARVEKQVSSGPKSGAKKKGTSGAVLGIGLQIFVYLFLM